MESDATPSRVEFDIEEKILQELRRTNELLKKQHEQTIWAVQRIEKDSSKIHSELEGIAQFTMIAVIIYVLSHAPIILASIWEMIKTGSLGEQ